MTVIRDATPDDVEGIGAIWNPIIRDTAISFWPTPRTDAEIAAYVADRQSSGTAFLVSQDGEGRITGLATYHQFRAGGGYARSMEHSLYLGPDQRGTGLGRLLLRAVEDHARARNHRLMIGVITGENTVSMRFHARMGYAQWGRIPAAGWKLDRFHDAVILGKDLWEGHEAS